MILRDKTPHKIFSNLCLAVQVLTSALAAYLFAMLTLAVVIGTAHSLCGLL